MRRKKRVRGVATARNLNTHMIFQSIQTSHIHLKNEKIKFFEYDCEIAIKRAIVFTVLLVQLIVSGSRMV
jgi:hypothetical protein